MTIILYGNLANNDQRNEIELLTRELRRAWASIGFQVVSEVDNENERKIKIFKVKPLQS